MFDIEIGTATPGEIKKFITGRGNANKEAVKDAVRGSLLPMVSSEDEADAVALLALILSRDFSLNLATLIKVSK